mgnify:CR=1 FL=1
MKTYIAKYALLGMVLVLIGGCAAAAPPAVSSQTAGELPEWTWQKLTLLYMGKEYPVELVASDPERRQYLTTPFPNYPNCGGACLTVLEPSGRIVKVIRREDRDRWQTAEPWRQYAYAASGYFIARFPGRQPGRGRLRVGRQGPARPLPRDAHRRLAGDDQDRGRDLSRLQDRGCAHPTGRRELAGGQGGVPLDRSRPEHRGQVRRLGAERHLGTEGGDSRPWDAVRVPLGDVGAWTPGSLRTRRVRPAARQRGRSSSSCRPALTSCMRIVRAAFLSLCVAVLWFSYT